MRHTGRSSAFPLSAVGAAPNGQLLLLAPGLGGNLAAEQAMSAGRGIEQNAVVESSLHSSSSGGEPTASADKRENVRRLHARSGNTFSGEVPRGFFSLLANILMYALQQFMLLYVIISKTKSWLGLLFLIWDVPLLMYMSYSVKADSGAGSSESSRRCAVQWMLYTITVAVKMATVAFAPSNTSSEKSLAFLDYSRSALEALQQSSSFVRLHPDYFRARMNTTTAGLANLALSNNPQFMSQLVQAGENADNFLVFVGICLLPVIYVVFTARAKAAMYPTINQLVSVEGLLHADLGFSMTLDMLDIVVMFRDAFGRFSNLSWLGVDSVMKWICLAMIILTVTAVMCLGFAFPTCSLGSNNGDGSAVSGVSAVDSSSSAAAAHAAISSLNRTDMFLSAKYAFLVGLFLVDGPFLALRIYWIVAADAVSFFLFKNIFSLLTRPLRLNQCRLAEREKAKGTQKSFYDREDFTPASYHSGPHYTSSAAVERVMTQDGRDVESAAEENYVLRDAGERRKRAFVDREGKELKAGRDEERQSLWRTVPRQCVETAVAVARGAGGGGSGGRLATGRGGLFSIPRGETDREEFFVESGDDDRRAKAAKQWGEGFSHGGGAASSRAGSGRFSSSVGRATQGVANTAVSPANFAEASHWKSPISGGVAPNNPAEKGLRRFRVERVFTFRQPATADAPVHQAALVEAPVVATALTDHQDDEQQSIASQRRPADELQHPEGASDVPLLLFSSAPQTLSPAANWVDNIPSISASTEKVETAQPLIKAVRSTKASDASDPVDCSAIAVSSELQQQQQQEPKVVRMHTNVSLHWALAPLTGSQPRQRITYSHKNVLASATPLSGSVLPSESPAQRKMPIAQSEQNEGQRVDALNPATRGIEEISSTPLLRNHPYWSAAAVCAYPSGIPTLDMHMAATGEAGEPVLSTPSALRPGNQQQQQRLLLQQRQHGMTLNPNANVLRERSPPISLTTTGKAVTQTRSQQQQRRGVGLLWRRLSTRQLRSTATDHQSQEEEQRQRVGDTMEGLPYGSTKQWALYENGSAAAPYPYDMYPVGTGHPHTLPMPTCLSEHTPSAAPPVSLLQGTSPYGEAGTEAEVSAAYRPYMRYSHVHAHPLYQQHSNQQHRIYQTAGGGLRRRVSSGFHLLQKRAGTERAAAEQASHMRASSLRLPARAGSALFYNYDHSGPNGAGAARVAADIAAAGGATPRIAEGEVFLPPHQTEYADAAEENKYHHEEQQQLVQRKGGHRKTWKARKKLCREKKLLRDLGYARGLPVDGVGLWACLWRVTRIALAGGSGGLKQILDDALVLPYIQQLRLLLSPLCYHGMTLALFLLLLYSTPTSTKELPGPSVWPDFFPVISWYRLEGVDRAAVILVCTLLPLQLVFHVFAAPLLDVLFVSVGASVRLLGSYMLLRSMVINLTQQLSLMPSNLQNHNRYIGLSVCCVFLAYPAYQLLVLLLPAVFAICNKRYFNFKRDRRKSHGDWRGGERVFWCSSCSSRRYTVSNSIIFYACREYVAPLSYNALLCGADVFKDMRLLDNMTHAQMCDLALLLPMQLCVLTMRLSWYSAGVFLGHDLFLFTYSLVAQTVRILSQRRYELKLLLQDLVQQRTVNVLAPFLPLQQQHDDYEAIADRVGGGAEGERAELFDSVDREREAERDVEGGALGDAGEAFENRGLYRRARRPKMRLSILTAADLPQEYQCSGFFSSPGSILPQFF